MKNLIIKYRFLITVILINAAVMIFQPHIEIDALSFAGANLSNFLFMLTPVFILTGLMDVWIERDTIIRIMGESSGIKGVLASLAIGMITAVPMYALLPVAGMLLKKGSRISNVLLFLCASSGIRIPLLLFEISSFGWKFTFVRLCLNIIIIFAIAFITEKLLTDADKKTVYDNSVNP